MSESTEISLLQAKLERLTEENRKLSRQVEQSTDDMPSSRLWSGISHEILTPMDAILGMTELVLNEDLSDKQKISVEMIHESATRLFNVLSDVIDYSDIREGRLRRDIVNFNFFHELEYDLYVADLSAKHSDISFTVNFDKEIPDYLQGDPARLRQVLNTLIGNAIHRTEKGGVTLSITSEGYDDKGRLLLRFAVQDMGKGVSSEVDEKIFSQPLGPGFLCGEEKYSEGGLGLVVAARLVHLFGGDIGVKKNEENGSTFWFTWPLVNPSLMHMGELSPEIENEETDIAQILKGARVLLAEDEFINASVTRAFLEQAGVNVHVAVNGKEALEAVSRERFQAILMDVQMPVMNGLQATSKIRRKERKMGVRSPIIALTAHAMEGDRERCFQAGMDDYLAKPLDKDQLIEMLARYLRRKALIVGNDSQRQQRILQPLIERGWSVVLAETGRMAMYEASLSTYDLIIVDMSLPVDDGLKTVEAIRQLEKFSGCRAEIIAIGDEKGPYAESDFDDFLQDDLKMEALMARVEAFI